MADEKVQFTITARDMATARIKNLRGELAAMGGTAGGLAGPMRRLADVTGGFITPATLAFGAATALAGGFVAAAKAAIEEEKGVNLLTQAIRANDPAAVKNIATIEATITERQKLAFADDEQRESLGALVAVTKDADKALELQRTAMDLARLKGIDLATATTLIGKVYGGNLGILARYGIQLKKGSTATEALAEIQRRAAGQAEAYGDTTAGAMESARLALNDVVEDLGAKLMPALTKLAVFARDTVAPALSAIVDNAEILGEVIGHLPFVSTANQMNEMLDKQKVAIKAATQRIEHEAKAQSAAWLHGAQSSVDAYSSVAPELETVTRRIAALPRQMMVAEHQAIRAAAYQSQVELAKGLMDGQDAPRVAMDAALQMVETELTDAQEMVRLQGQLLTLRTAAGIADAAGKDASLVAINGAIQVVLDRIALVQSDFYQGGYNMGVAWANGLRSSADFARLMAWEVAASANRALHGRSPPKEGPLSDIDIGGLNVGKAWAAGLGSAARFGRSNAGDLASAAAGVLGGAMVPGFTGSAPALAGGGAGITVHSHLYLDGKQVAENVTRHQYYAQPAGASVLPRGI